MMHKLLLLFISLLTAPLAAVAEGVPRADPLAQQALMRQAVLRLDRAYAVSTRWSPELMSEPVPGRACLVMGYPVAESPEPAYPALSAGLVFRAAGADAVQTTVAQTAGFSGAPVFDAHGRWLGLSLGASGGAGGQVLAVR